jgi:succinate dehydrogenase hydrophobic anchor subunit
MKSERSILFSLAAGFVLTAVVIVGAALLLIPQETRSQLFWPRVLWTVCLSGLIWGAGGSYFTIAARKRAQHREVGGIAPSFLVVVVLYAILSFAAMLFHATIPAGETSSRIHMLLQMSLAGVAAIILVFLNLARTHAGLGVQTVFEGVESPSQLSDILAAEESRLATLPENETWTKCLQALKSLRETLKYSLPQTTVVADNPIYGRLAGGIKATCRTLHECRDPSADTVARCVTDLNALRTEAKTLSSTAIRR